MESLVAAGSVHAIDCAAATGACGCATTPARGSVEIADAVADERAIRIDSVSSVETVQHSLSSGCVDFENSPEVVHASPAGRAVQIAGGIAEQACLGNAAVWSAGELVQRCFLARGAYFENSSGIGAEPAAPSCAVNIPR